MSMMGNQILKRSNINSTMEGRHIIRPKNSISKKWPGASLTLTSLVDAFTILVVYLLVATTFGTEQIDVPKSLQLPKASSSEPGENGLVVRAQNGRYYLDNREIRIDDLSDALEALKETKGTDVVIIQADKTENFAKLNPAVLSILQAGFAKVRFAVLHEDES